MADVKISELPAADQANVDDLLEASQVSGPGYVTRRISLDQVSSLVAASDQVQGEIDDAIGALPPPVSDWADITGKPATFPPTLPIPESGVTNLVSDLALKAPIASPTFTGDPKAPTPATADDDTSIATTAYVKANLAALSTTPSGAAGGDLAGSYPNPLIKPSVTNGQVLTTTAGVAGWAAPTGGGGGAATAVGPTPPGSPTDGQLWYYSDAVAAGGGQLMIRYNDGTSTAWVPASPSVETNTGVLQTVSTQTGASATGTTVIPFDTTIPQITEGDQYLMLAITPRSATSRLVIEAILHLRHSATGAVLAAALFQDSTANALATGAFYAATANGDVQVQVRHVMTAGTTSPTTFRVRAGSGSAGTTTLNVGASYFGGTLASSIVIQEVV